jgi:uncharacterized protein YbbK (DUF523 family)
MREFVAKKKKVKVSIEGVSYEMRYPSLDEKEAFDQKVAASEQKEFINTCKELFSSLGLPKEAAGKMDADDFVDFIGFIFSPKSQGPQA